MSRKMRYTVSAAVAKNRKGCIHTAFFTKDLSFDR